LAPHNFNIPFIVLLPVSQHPQKKRLPPHTNTRRHASDASTNEHLRYVTAIEQNVVQTALEILPGWAPVAVACCLNLCFPSLHCSSLFPSRKKGALALAKETKGTSLSPQAWHLL
jgi:hypothetical protein